MAKFTPKEIREANEWAGFFSFKESDFFRTFMRCGAKLVALFTGNQFGKTAYGARHYVYRFVGLHPIADKNFDYLRCTRNDRHKESLAVSSALKARYAGETRCPACESPMEFFCSSVRKVRFASENLPFQNTAGDASSGNAIEVRNTQYPELMKWMPGYLVKKNITQRNPVLVVRDIHGGADIVVEYVSYNQKTQAMAGVQLNSCWCVAKGQRVLMSDGVWRNIESIRPGDEIICETMGGYGKGQRTNRVKSMIEKGAKPTIRVNCQKGISFEVTSDHLVMVPGRVAATKEYRKAGDLRPGDKIICRMNRIEGKKTIDDWLLANIAVLIGDGSIGGKSGATPVFSFGKPEILVALKKITPLGIRYRIQQMPGGRVPNCFIVDDTSKGANRVKDALKRYGLWGSKSGDKFVPEEVFRQDCGSIALFLSYLYATDGWANGHSVGYCSTSKRLSDDVQLLLRRLGIRSTRQRRVFQNGWNDQYWITIAMARDVLEFVRLVGIVGKEKNLLPVISEARRRLASSRARCSFGNVDIESSKPSTVKQTVLVKSVEPSGIQRVYDLVMDAGQKKITKRADRKCGTGTRNDRRSPRNNFVIQGGVVVHNCDEQPPADFLEEQFPRLLAADGDMLITLTAADRVSYLYDKVYEQARVYHRTPTIARVYSMPTYEKTTSRKSIAVFQAATDDNPTLLPEVVNRLFTDEDDENVISIRRYGVFQAVSGRVFKTFTPMIHVIEEEKHFPDGIPAGNWVHARMIDWHDRVPWAFVWAALSPRDEMFIVRDGNFDPDRYITEEIARQIAILSGERIRFKLDRIDPLATKKQPNTGKSSADDLNNAINRFKREGVKLDSGTVIHPTGANFESWDTKSEHGREAVKTRLKNALTCKRPFNNIVTEEGQSRYLPTLWVLDCCVHTAKSLKNWRRDEWSDAAAAVSKDPRETLQQKWSHHCMCLEAILKEVYFKARKDTIETFTDRRQRPSYFSRTA